MLKTSLKKIILTAMLMAFVPSTLSLFADNRIAPRSRHAIAKLREAAAETNRVACFIKVEDAGVVSQLQELGVEVNHCFGTIVTAQVPVDKIDAVSRHGKVRRVQLAQKMSVCNDAARAQSMVGGVHSGEQLTMPYTGKDVVLGMVDVGIDFNHIEFRDGDGNSRVKSVYMPTDRTGTSPVVGGNRLPGSAYTTDAEIGQLTSDSRILSHGTHTTTTAAGSYMGNDYYGVATEADLVLCAMPDDSLTDINVANSVAFIFDYADKVGKPAVVNMSLSSNAGPHDGTSMICQAFKEAAGQGKICVLSVGNDAKLCTKLTKTFAEPTDTLSTFLENLYALYTAHGDLDMWSSNDKPFRMQLVVVDRTTHAVLYQSPWYNATDDDDNAVTINARDDAFLSQYYKGEITFCSGIGDNGKMELYTTFDFDYTCAKEVARNHFFGVRFCADQGTTLTGWSNTGTQLVSNGIDGWVYGTPDGNISDMVTGDGTISVGAYCSKTQVTQLGGVGNYDRSQLGDIAFFSSYGKDMNGVGHPLITAPGYAVVSAMNRYDEEDAADIQHLSLRETIGDQTYSWGTMYGTSQSAPVVSGTIATWLQAKPTLTTDDVKTILEETSLRDAFVTSGNADRWGYGKLDALKGLQKIVNSGVESIDADKMWTLTTNPQSMTLISPVDGKLTVDVYSVAGQAVRYCEGEVVSGTAKVDFANPLASGAYIVRAKVAGLSHSFKLIIK